MMRRFLTWVAVLSFALPSVASAQVVVGIGAGLRSASLSIEDNDDDDLPDSRTGIGISGFVSIPNLARPRPLNLIYLDLEDANRTLDADTIRFRALDFDAY